MSIIVEKSIAVPMRDGVVLRADVYRPQAPGPHPVLLQRTPYNRELWPITAMTLDPVTFSPRDSVRARPRTRPRALAASN